MPNTYQHDGGDALTLPTQKLLLSLSLEDLERFVCGLDMEELTELLRFYETEECFEACIVVRNYMKSDRKRQVEVSTPVLYL